MPPLLCCAYSALEVDQERHQDHLSQQRVLQDRVRQLEAEARASLTEKTRLVDKLSSERGEGLDMIRCMLFIHTV